LELEPELAPARELVLEPEPEPESQLALVLEPEPAPELGLERQLAQEPELALEPARLPGSIETRSGMYTFCRWYVDSYCLMQKNRDY
jgi:hypothetical protein